MIDYDVKFLSCDETLQLKNNDFKSYKYETRKKVEEPVHGVAKRNYYERRGGHWRAPHPRHIRQLESKLRAKNIVVCEWTTAALITIVFSSGVIAYLTIKPDTLDVVQILFDRYFVGKLYGQIVTNAALCKSHILFTHADRTATLVTFGKTATILPYRITDRDPHLQNIELGGSTRRTERRISKSENNSSARVLVWSASTVEPAPWSPIIEDHANLHLYQITGQNISLVAYHQLENETLCAELSWNWDNLVHIVEQVACHKNGVNLVWLQYEIPHNEDRSVKLSTLRESALHVSLPAPARVVRRSPCDQRLLAACIDGSLHILHHTVGVTHSTRAGFIATEVQWAGQLIIAAEEGGRLQCFDRALSLLHHHIKCLDLTSYLSDARRMQLLATWSARRGPFILVSFTGGPLTLLRITHPQLLTAWIRTKRTSNAVALLRALDWEHDGTECLWAANKLVCSALRSGSEAAAEEGAAQAALGSFLAARVPLPPAAMRFAPPVHDLARKFFHHLLRRGRVEKALSLAVDLAAWDLFVDARWAASRRGLQDLADEAASLASHYAQQETPESECSGSCSRCSSHSYTDSDDETSASSEVAKTKPPPLPRVSLPNHPTLISVPITQTENISTNSIRPNLHQYLDKDATIWNTEVRDDFLKPNGYEIEHFKQNIKWNGLDNVVTNYRGLKQNLSTSDSRMKSRTATDVISRHDDRISTPHFKHWYRGDIQEVPNTLYRYQNNNNHPPSTSKKDQQYRNEIDASGRQGNRSGEKNKVKFSDTVTIAVVSEPEMCPEPARELAESLPICAPHNYLSAFAPHPQTSSGAHQSENSTMKQKPPKIKVVHFGRV